MGISTKRTAVEVSFLDNEMFLILLTLPSLLFACAGAAPEVCAGCPVTAEVNQEIVDFAVSELQGGEQGKCLRKVIKVENFESQVVAGMLYKFDLVLKHDHKEADTCIKASGEEERCKVEVYDIPWQQQRELTSTTCLTD